MKLVVYIAIMLCFYSLGLRSLVSQDKQEPRWVTGKGSAQGTDLSEMRLKALNAARADALSKVGIVVTATDISIKSESNQSLTDFYTRFAESATRGLILEERNVKVSDPIRFENEDDDLTRTYEIDVTLEAFVVLQSGEPDPGFEVKLETNRDSYQEDEPVSLTITSTRDGYLTLFSIENDSLSILLPMSLHRDNVIKSHAPLVFPTSDGYSLRLKTIPGKTKSEITFVAIVSKDDVLFSPIKEAQYEGKYLKLKQAMLTHYAKWLYKIPVDKRSSDVKAVQVLKREKD